MTKLDMQQPLNPNAPARQNTFSRAFTFEGGAFTRASTQFGRSITDGIGLTYNNEEQWTKSLIAEYVKISHKGVDGDMPIPAGFAREKRFWRMMFLAGLFGALMGLTGCGFLNLTDETPRQWSNFLDNADPIKFDYWQGEPYWIAITTGCGFTVGLLRFLINFPDTIDGIFKEINTYHVDYTIAPQAIVLSCISLAGGAALGPEQALGTVGGGLGSYVAHIMPDLDEDDKKLLVLVGMSAAIGSLFPSPILTVMMLYELGHPPRSMMEAVTILSFASTVAFIVNFALVAGRYTFLTPITTNGIFLAYAWDYQNWQCVTGFVIGIISGCLSLTSIVFIGVTKQIFQRFRKRLERNKFLQTVLPPTVAGVIIGVCNYAVPGTIGNGNLVLAKIVSYGHDNQLSTHLLLSTGFLRMLLLGVSMNCVGFVGGFIFPTITIAIIAGVICYQQYSYLPYGLCLGCFIAGVPAGICPMPFTLACLAIFIFYFGAFQTTPIIISTITSYTVVCGSGLFGALQTRAKAQEAAAAAEAAGLPPPKPVDENAARQAKAMQNKEDSLSLAKYLNAKSGAVVGDEEEN